MPWSETISPASSATRTTSGAGSACDMGAWGSAVPCTTAVLTLLVTAASGTTPSLAVTVETSPDGATWRTLGSFTAATAVGAQKKRFPGADRYVRAKWVLSGTDPSFTFGVSGERVQVYATPANFDELGINAEAFSDYDAEQKDKWLCSATDDADGYLEGGKFKLPLKSWGDDIRQHVVNLAVFKGMKKRGFNPAKDSPDALVVDGKDESIRWFEKARDEKVMPRGIDATPDTYEGGAYVVSRAKRVWGR
jgi:phage gp36-like protein